MIEPRKQPRQHRSRSKVEAILAAAADLCAGRGLEALTTNAVAARAGVSIGSLYQYFPGKEALVAALIRAERANLLQAVEGMVSSDDTQTVIQLADNLIGLTLAHHLERPALTHALGLARLHLPPDAEAAEFSARVTVMTAARFRDLNLPEPETAAQDVLAILRGLAQAASEVHETDHNALAARARRAVLGYLGAA